MINKPKSDSFFLHQLELLIRSSLTLWKGCENVNPIPTRLCHVIYCCCDKSYPCLVGIVLTRTSTLITVTFTQPTSSVNGL